MPADTGNKRAVRILLDCILVSSCFLSIVHFNLPVIFEIIAGVGDGEKIVVN